MIYENNNTKIFSITKKMKKLYCIICDKYGKFAVSARMKMKKYLKKKNQLKY